MKLFLLNALIFVLLTFSQALFANDLYRCGSSYQDKPCNGKINSQDISRKTPQTLDNIAIESQSDLIVNANCQQRGESAKAIAKLRDEGITENQQINATSDQISKTMIKDVYRHRGSALQLQNTFEHECLQVIEKVRLTKKQITDSERLRNSDVSHSSNEKLMANNEPTVKIDQLISPSQATSQTPSKRTAQSEQTVTTSRSFAEKTRNEPIVEKAEPAKTTQDENDELGICKTFKAGIDNITSQKPKNGNAAQLKDLNQQKEHLKREMKRAGC